MVLCKQLLNPKPSQRPSANKVLKMPFVVSHIQRFCRENRYVTKLYKLLYLIKYCIHVLYTATIAFKTAYHYLLWLIVTCNRTVLEWSRRVRLSSNYFIYYLVNLQHCPALLWEETEHCQIENHDPPKVARRPSQFTPEDTMSWTLSHSDCSGETPSS